MRRANERGEYRGNLQSRPVGRAIAKRRIDVLGDPSEGMGTMAFARPVGGKDRIAVISDVHGNLHALAAVLRDVDAAGIDRIWCLGDTTGYGANPLECLRLVRERCELVLAGNHDLAVVGDESLGQFSEHARPGVRLAQRQLELVDDGPVLREWLALRLTEVTDARRSIDFDLTYARHLNHHTMDAMASNRIVAAHAAPTPWDAVWDYVGVNVDPAEVRSELNVPLVLVGHTHRQFAYDHLGFHDDEGQRIPIEPCGHDDPSGRGRGAVIANPGSVGQPRDGDPRAAWLELDESKCMLTLHRTEYDISSSRAAIEDAGLPGETGARLELGE